MGPYTVTTFTWISTQPAQSLSLRPSPHHISSRSPTAPHPLFLSRHPQLRPRRRLHSTILSCTPSPAPPPSPPPSTPDTRGIQLTTIPFYLALVAAQCLPLLIPHSGTAATAGDITYFTVTALSCLIIGSRRASLTPPSLSAPLTSTQALLAPFVASFALFGSYLLLKYTPVNISLLFNALTTFAGSLCLKETLDPVCHSLLSLAGLENATLLPNKPNAESETLTAAAPSVDAASQSNPSDTGPWGLSGVLSSTIALATTAAYLSHVPPTYVFSNVLAIGICSRVLSLVRPTSFPVAAALLSGLLCYDIFWVFGSEVMVSVATQIDSPGKLLYPRDVIGDGMKYPYAILGLGDVCVPGIFVSLAQAMDRGLGGVRDGEEPYFLAAIVAYTLGLGTCFGVNFVTGAAQPALLYLVPALILSAVAVGSVRGELGEVLSFRVEDDGDGPGGRSALQENES
eukprot:GFKZ01004342.1.p1 GENE.GFKZ01004342.1~~GFKZ01004342.1.p1  ORF type:complete len:457 (-),score=34.00 GFKZ01004342.1:176-1546(-)